MASRLPVSLTASALLHLLALGVLVRLPAPTEFPALVVIPVSLVGGLGGGGGGEGGEATEAVARPAAAPPANVAVARPAPAKPRAHPRPAPVARQADPAPIAADVGAGETALSGVAGGGGSGDGAGAGSGGADAGGDGSGGARVAYGSNPLPPYPRVARNLGIEGVVLLDILVTADGRAREVRVLESSGYAPLDDSAVSTVRRRWRFVPARRGDTAIDSRVRVPIRFRLEDARG